MISTLIGLLGLAGWGGGALGIAGVALKLLGYFAPTAAASVLSNPITAAVGKVAEGFVDLITWAIKGVLTYVGSWLAGGFDHISKDARSFAILMALCWASYSLGGIGRYYDAPQAKSPPAAKSESSRATPKTAAPKKPQTIAPFDPFDWISNAFR
jgi:hypothetical protein